MAFNKVILMGNLTADPELRTTPNGQNLASFTIAINRVWNSSNGERQEEGNQLLVSGRLQQRTWQDKDTGKNRSALDVVVEEFSFVNDGNRNGNSTSKNSEAEQPFPGGQGIDSIPNDDEEIDLSDIPF